MELKKIKTVYPDNPLSNMESWFWYIRHQSLLYYRYGYIKLEKH